MKGCYGSVVCFSPNKKVCMDCTLSVDCLNDVKRGIVQLSTDSPELDLSLHKRRIYQLEITKTPEHSRKREILSNEVIKAIDSLSIGIGDKKLLTSLLRKGLTEDVIRRSLQKGINPIANSTPFSVKALCHLILKNHLTRNNLANLILLNGCSKKTALSRANKAINVFIVLGIIDKSLKTNGK